jgi:hypothetical protein
VTDLNTHRALAFRGIRATRIARGNRITDLNTDRAPGRPCEAAP